MAINTYLPYMVSLVHDILFHYVFFLWLCVYFERKQRNPYKITLLFARPSVYLLRQFISRTHGDFEYRIRTLYSDFSFFLSQCDKKIIIITILGYFRISAFEDEGRSYNTINEKKRKIIFFNSGYINKPSRISPHCVHFA